MSGTNLTVLSNSGTSADAGAQALGFAESSSANIANTGSLAAVNDVRQIFVSGTIGTQDVRINGGTFPALSIGPGGDIENVTFQTESTILHSISASAPNANLDITATGLLTVNAQVISSDFDPITLSAKSMALNSLIGDDSQSTPVTLRQASAASRDIDLGGSSAGMLALNTSEINLVSASILKIGRPDNPGIIRITNAISPAMTDHLELFTGGAIQDSNNLAGNDLAVSRLGMAAGTGIGVSGLFPTIEIQADYLEAQTNTGGIQTQQDAGAVVIGEVSPEIHGLHVINSGDLLLSTINGSITLNDDDGWETVRGGDAAGNVVLTANGSLSNFSSQVNRDAVTAPNGSIILSAGQDILLGTIGTEYDNDVRASESITLSAGRDVTIDGFSDISSDDFGRSTGGSVHATAGRNISIARAHGEDASLGASGWTGGGVTLVTGPNSLLTISTGSWNTLFSYSGDVTVNADRVAISTSSEINAANHTVTIQPVSNNWKVNLGSTTDAAADTLELSDAELDRVTAGVVRIGDISNTAALQITGQITAASYPTLSLLSRGAITESTALEQSDLTAANLALQSSNAIGGSEDADLDTNVTQLAFAGASETVNVNNAGPLTIGSVDGLGSSSSTGSDVRLNAAGSLTFAANTTSAGELEAVAYETEATTDDITVGEGITVRANGGATLAAGDRINLRPGSAVISDSSTAGLGPGYEDMDGLGSCEIRGRLQGLSIQVVGGAANDAVIIDYTAGAILTTQVGFSGSDGDNSLIVTDAGSGTAHGYTVSAASLVRDSIPVISLKDVGSVTVNGGNASDIFDVSSSGTVDFSLFGGLPNLPAQPGDRISIDIIGGTNPEFKIDSIVDGYSGSWSFGNLHPVTFTAFETVTPTPALTLTNSDGVTAARQGATTTYTLVATNNSPFTVNGVKMSNPLPDGVTGGTYTSTAIGDVTGNTTSGTGAIHDTLGMPAGSSVTYTMAVTIAHQAHGPLNNTASLVGLDVVSVTDSDSLAPLIDLSITNTDGVTSVTPGESFTYTIFVRNGGPDTADGAVVSVPLDTGITGASYTSEAAGGATGNTTSGAGPINDLLAMPAGSSVTYTVTATIDPAATGWLVHTAMVAAPASAIETNPDNNQAGDNNSLAPLLDLGITNTDGVTTVNPGVSITYTIVVRNHGPSTADGAVVTVPLDAVLTGTGYTSTAAEGATGNTASGTGAIHDTLWMPPGSSVTYTVTAIVDPMATGSFVSTAAVSAPVVAIETNPGNNLASDDDIITLYSVCLPLLFRQ